MDSQIVYHDFAGLSYASFYLSGFHQNQEAWGYEFTVSKEPPRPLLNARAIGGWGDILFSVCVFHASTPSGDFYFCVDTRDSSRADASAGKGYHLPLLEEAKFYFKVNFDERAVSTDVNLRAHAAKIIPALPFFPIRPPQLRTYFPRVVPCNAMRWTARSAARRCRDLVRIPSLGSITCLRQQKKELDVFFVVNYYHEEEHQEANEFRCRLMRAIQHNPRLNARVGFVGSDLPPAYRDLEQPWLSLGDHLAWVAKSRVGVYVRGLHDCVSFKFGQLLAMGMPIAGQPIRGSVRGIIDDGSFGAQFAYDEPEAIADRAAELLSRPDELARLGACNARAFDSEFAPQATVNRMLGVLLPKAGSQ